GELSLGGSGFLRIRLNSLEQTVVRGKKRELDATGSTHLIKHVSEMTFDRVFADRKSTGDLLVRVSHRNPVYDFQLAPCESKCSCPAPFRIELTANSARARNTLTDPEMPGHHGANALKERVCG